MLLVVGFAIGVVIGASAAGWAERWRARGRDRQLDETADALREAFASLHAESEARVRASQAALAVEVRTLAGAGARVADEASKLAAALRVPTARGRWGELQLRRVVELAGLCEHVDFDVQAEVDGEDGALRPDLVVHLPGGRHVAVDAKAPLDAYLAAADAADELARRARLVEHARAVRRHARALSAKGYARALGGALDLVVMFLPADAALAAALEAEPTLLEALVGERVVVATPATLVALLRAVAAGWREAQAAESAREAAALGRELYARLRTLVGAFTAMRRGLDAAVEGYNRAAASLEMRVLVSARRLGALGMDDGKALDAPEAAEATPASSWPGTSR